MLRTGFQFLELTWRQEEQLSYCYWTECSCGKAWHCNYKNHTLGGRGRDEEEMEGRLNGDATGILSAVKTTLEELRKITGNKQPVWRVRRGQS